MTDEARPVSDPRDPLSWQANRLYQTLNAHNQQRTYRLKQFLGGGRTSIVWLAEELGAESVNRRKVALKILKPLTAMQWQPEFENEILVMRELWAAEEGVGDGMHCIPRLYDVSPRGAQLSYLSMEYVPYPSVSMLAQPPTDLPKRASDMKADAELLAKHLRQLHFDLPNIIKGEVQLSTAAAGTNEQMSQVVQMLDGLSSGLARWHRENAGLDGEEVALIGAQVCRVLQLLHDSGRTYRDLQLHNIHWDRESKHVKILDWNAVSSDGSRFQEGIQRDLLRLAKYLFWLRTLVEIPEQGVDVRALARWGGSAWMEETTFALRLVVERALDTRPESRYSEAFGASKAEDTQTPLEQIGSMGAALLAVGKWYQSHPGSLLQLAVGYREGGFTSSAYAALEMAQRRLELEESDRIREGLAVALDELQKELDQSLTRPAFETGLRLLEALDLSEAVTELARAVEEQHDDLLAHRWFAAARSMKDLKHEQAQTLWESRQLHEAILALSGERWGEAQRILDAIAESNVDVDVLRADARLGALLGRAEGTWRAFEDARRQGLRSMEQELARELLDGLDEAARLLSSLPTHPYLQTAADAWPNQRLWREKAAAVLERRPERIAEEIRESLMRAGETPESFAFAVGRIGSSLAAHPGDSDLLKISIEAAQGLLRSSSPDRAATVLGAALRYIGTSPYGVQLRELLQTAEAWIRLRRTLQVSDWDSAVVAADTLRAADDATHEVLASELHQQFEGVAQAGELDRARRLSVVMAQLGVPESRYQPILQDLEERTAMNERKWIKSALSRIAELAEENTLESLEEARNWAKTTLLKLPTDEPACEEIREQLRSIEERIQRKHRDAERQKRRREASAAEKAGDDLSEGLDAGEIRKAEQYYVLVKGWFEALEDHEGVARVTSKLDQVQRILSMLPDLHQSVSTVGRLLENIGPKLELGLHAEVARSPLLEQLCAELSNLQLARPQAAIVKKLSSRALALVRALGWPPERFWALVKPTDIEWYGSALAELPPTEVDETWLHKVDSALKKTDARAGVEVHDDIPVRLGRWLREEAQLLLDDARRGRTAAAAAAAPRVVMLHGIMRRLKQYTAPDDSVGRRVPESSEQMNPGAPETVDDLLRWLDDQPDSGKLRALIDLVLAGCGGDRVPPEVPKTPAEKPPRRKHPWRWIAASMSGAALAFAFAVLWWFSVPPPKWLRSIPPVGPSPTVTLLPTQTPVAPTSTYTPTPTSTATPTLTATWTPSPTLSPTPTGTPSPEPVILELSAGRTLYRDENRTYEIGAIELSQAAQDASVAVEAHLIDDFRGDSARVQIEALLWVESADDYAALPASTADAVLKTRNDLGTSYRLRATGACTETVDGVPEPCQIGTLDDKNFEFLARQSGKGSYAEVTLTCYVERPQSLSQPSSPVTAGECDRQSPAVPGEIAAGAPESVYSYKTVVAALEDSATEVEDALLQGGTHKAFEVLGRTRDSAVLRVRTTDPATPQTEGWVLAEYVRLLPEINVNDLCIWPE